MPDEDPQTPGSVLYRRVLKHGAKAGQMRGKYARAVTELGEREATRIVDLAIKERPAWQRAIQCLGQWPPDARAYFKIQEQGSAHLKRALKVPRRLVARTPPHPTVASHAIDLLPEVERYCVIIDETGRANLRDGLDRGRFIALVLPYGVALPPDIGHATEDSPAVTEGRLQWVRGSQIGIFGISSRAIRGTDPPKWADLILELVTWVAHLIPLGKATRIEVAIEQYSYAEPTTQEDWSLPRFFHETVNRRSTTTVATSVNVVSKTGHLWNPYVDVVANGWHRATSLQQTPPLFQGLRLRYLLETTHDELAVARRCLLEPNSASIADWRELIAQPPAKKNVAHEAALRAIGAKARQNILLWQKLLSGVEQHTESKAVSIRDLEAECAWLADNRPAGAKLSAAAELAWRVVQLKKANRSGQIDSALDAAVAAAALSIRAQHPALACEATLVRAVQRTNMWEFDSAAEVLDEWQNATDNPLFPLQWRGRIWSQLGQLEAFRDDAASAVACFDQALGHFDQLRVVDENLANSESRHTNTYRAIAMLANPDASPDAKRGAMKRLHSLRATDIEALASSDDRAGAFVHHAVLRWLNTNPDSAEAKAYLSKRHTWAKGVGHPWGLIDLQRALLLGPSIGETISILKRAADACSTGGPTLRLIGNAIEAVGYCWKLASFQEPTLAEVERTLPGAAGQIAILEDAIRERADPVDWLPLVLPFQYR